MSEESTNLDLEHLTEQTTEQIMFVVGSTPGDPKADYLEYMIMYQMSHSE